MTCKRNYALNSQLLFATQQLGKSGAGVQDITGPLGLSHKPFNYTYKIEKFKSNYYSKADSKCPSESCKTYVVYVFAQPLRCVVC